MKKPDYSNLNNKTIFDFTDDEGLIKKVIGGLSKDYYLNSNPFVLINGILDFARLTSNAELEKRALKTHKIVEKELYSYAAQREKEEPGLIVCF